ncbi:hypothetical protein AX15_003967 [Amanita polypyramis BW_CC]|nr:hypothetical protein AX15_003967 [Amanita polypyramis BW_CC]
MSNLTVLRSYVLREPINLPKSILYSCTNSVLVLFDAYPKSIFHFLVLPPVRPPFTAEDLTNLRTLFKKDTELAKEVIQELKTVAQSLKQDIEEEMTKRYGFKWEIWIGFHAVPSMLHLHLHVLSADLCSEKMKNKKHYNSFHPKLGFFLDIDTVISWFDATQSSRNSMVNTKPTRFGRVLKEPLTCFRCGMSAKNMVVLKEHLQKEWDVLLQEEKTRLRKENLDIQQKELVGAGSSCPGEERLK